MWCEFLKCIKVEFLLMIVILVGGNFCLVLKICWIISFILNLLLFEGNFYIRVIVECLGCLFVEDVGFWRVFIFVVFFLVVRFSIMLFIYFNVNKFV